MVKGVGHRVCGSCSSDFMSFEILGSFHKQPHPNVEPQMLSQHPLMIVQSVALVYQVPVLVLECRLIYSAFNY